LAVLAMVAAGCGLGARPDAGDADLRARTVHWGTALAHHDLGTLTDLAHPDYSHPHLISAALRDEVGTDARVEVGDLIFDHGQIRAVCLRLRRDGDRANRVFGVVFRKESGAWRVWEMRPDMQGCADDPGL
jgi:hypothetical protein